MKQAKSAVPPAQCFLFLLSPVCGTLVTDHQTAEPSVRTGKLTTYEEVLQHPNEQGRDHRGGGQTQGALTSGGCGGAWVHGLMCVQWRETAASSSRASVHGSRGR